MLENILKCFRLRASSTSSTLWSHQHLQGKIESCIQGHVVIWQPGTTWAKHQQNIMSRPPTSLAKLGTFLELNSKKPEQRNGNEMQRIQGMAKNPRAVWITDNLIEVMSSRKGRKKGINDVLVSQQGQICSFPQCFILENFIGLQRFKSFTNEIPSIQRWCHMPATRI